MSDSLKEAVKEGLRLTIFGAVSIFVSFLLDYLTKTNDQNVTIMVLTLVLRVIDKWMHEQDRGRLAKVNGLLPF